METGSKSSGYGLWGIIIGVFVVVISVVAVVLMNGGCNDDRANEELTWVG